MKMIETVTAVLGLVSAGIFLAHAFDAAIGWIAAGSGAGDGRGVDAKPAD